jgi:hypothetical protein
MAPSLLSAGPADNHDLHDFTSHDGFETTATPKPLATGSLSRSIRRLPRMEQSDLAVSRRLLRARRERPCRCRAADQRDELASPHIRSQARETQHCIGSNEYFDRG